MNILITGGAGYIGSVLISLLLQRGYNVACLDRFFFGQESIQEFMDNKRFKVIKDDIRWFDLDSLRGIDTVMDLASLSNDPSAELNPTKTMEINYRGRIRVAKASKKFGVKRYVLASSCSVYGAKKDIIADEKARTSPLTTYAKANVLAEAETLPLADKNFVTIVLRQATVYGLSPRMRFDLAVNGIVLGLHKTGKIPLMRSGKQWRPFVHVHDTARAFILAMESDPDKVNGQIFNIGSNEENYKIEQLAKTICSALRKKFIAEWYGSPDTRSYVVNFSKAKKLLGFKTNYTVKDGAKEIYDALKKQIIIDSLKTKTVEWYKHLINTHNFLQQVLIDNKVL
jgi:nucleoside-diphosphate-sugar epimerase